MPRIFEVVARVWVMLVGKPGGHNSKDPAVRGAAKRFFRSSAKRNSHKAAEVSYLGASGLTSITIRPGVLVATKY